MVDFPETYGFAPGGKAKVMQETFRLDIGVFSRAGGVFRAGRNRSPYAFEAVGFIGRQGAGEPIRGTLYKWGGVSRPAIEGTLQEVVTALCTIHRMEGRTK